MLTDLLKRAGGMSIGTVIGQGVVLLSMPWLARLYAPASFGVLALMVTASNIAIAVGAARFDLALPSADERDVVPLARVCVLTAMGAGALATVAAALVRARVSLGGPWHDVLGSPAMLGLCVFFSASFQIVSSVLLRFGRISLIAGLRALQGTLFVGIALLPNAGLAWAQVLSFAPAALLLPTMIAGKTADNRLADSVARYRVFALFGLPGAILDVVGYSLCVWIVTSIYGAASSGQMSQVQRIVGAPLMLVSISLGQILLRQSAELGHAPDQLKRLMLSLLGVLTMAGAAALVVLALVGGPALRLLLGSRWHVESAVVVAISAAVFVRASVSPLSSVLVTFRRLDLALRWQALYFVSALTIFSIASRMVSFDHFIMVYAVHEGILYMLYLRIILSVFRTR